MSRKNHCRKIQAALWLGLWSVNLPVAAAFSDAPVFQRPEDNARYQQLIREIRCPTCQNSDIGESNAPLARQLREQIARQIRQGKSNQDISAHLRESYGDFITYKPPLNAQTLVLWFAPFALMLAAALIFILNRRKKRPPECLSPAQAQQLQQWLDEEDCRS